MPNVSFLYGKCVKKYMGNVLLPSEMSPKKYLKKLDFFERFEKINTFNNITSAMFNAYLISTLKFQFEKNDEFNYITSAMFNAYLISTLKFGKNKYFG